MKKFFKLFTVVLVIMIICLVLAACGDKHSHSFGEWSVSKEATCTTDGLKERQCSCGEKETEVIPAGHDLQSHDEKSPTCTEIGWNAYETCSRCDYTTYEEKAKLNSVVRQLFESKCAIYI